MHEAAIVSSLIAILDQQARRHGVTRVRRVNLKVGQLTVVEPQALAFCFEAFAEGTVADGAELRIDHVHARARCRTCEADTAIRRFHFVCETCGGRDLALTAGEELYIESFEPG